MNSIRTRFTGFWPQAAIMAAALSLSTAALAQGGRLQLNATFQAAFDCERPFFVRDHPIRANFSAVLNADKTASADLVISGIILSNQVHFDARLGGGRQPAPGGTSQLRVVSSNRLRAIWDLPNNQLILDITAARSSCSTALSIKLKPGKREYTMFDGRRFHYCSNRRIIATSCQLK